MCQKLTYEELLEENTKLREELKHLGTEFYAQKEHEHSKFKTIFSYSPTGIITYDVNGNALEVNLKALEILGSPSVEATKKINFITFPPLKERGFSGKFIECVNTKKTIFLETNYTTKNGKDIFVECIFTPLFSVNSHVESVLTIFRDISEIKKIQIHLIKKKEEFAALAKKYQTQNNVLAKAKMQGEENFAKFVAITQQSVEGITVADMDGNYVFVNPAFCKMSGYTEDELLKLTVFDMKAKTQPYSTFNHSKTSLESKPFRAKLITKFGKEYVTEIIGKVINIRNHQFVLGTIRDITDTIKREKELTKAKEKAEESDRLKTEFINNMSHEIRTPMNGIMGFAEMLCKGEISPDKQKNYATIIHNSGSQLLRIIDDILEISELGTKQVKAKNENFCLNDLLLQQFSIFDIKAKENKTPLYLKKELTDAESFIYSDPSKITKIISNLLENALKFTTSGYIELACFIQNNWLHILVKDTGIGIDVEKQQIIFKRFSQAEKALSSKVGGLGLGLSIARENAELLGGYISLKSTKDQGAEFCLIIPYKLAEVPYIFSEYQEKNVQKGIQNILVAEDEEVNYLYMDALLHKIQPGIKIFHAKNGFEAIKLIKENPEINLILMDIKMPIMNGYEATKQIRTFNTEIPIIAQTAYSSRANSEKATTVGCTGYITKPIQELVLRKTIKKYL